MLKREHERAGYRHARLQEILLDEVRAWLRDEASDPALEGVRIAWLSLSVDYRQARIHYVVRGGSLPRRAEEVQTTLARASRSLRHQLATDLDLKRTPELRFIFDGFVAEEGASR